MLKTYYILGALLILISLGLVVLPPAGPEEQIPPEQLLAKVMSPSRFLSPDLVASRLIDEDPSILLVDVRPESDYKSYSLPGAINIPLKDILNEKWKPYLRQKSMDVVFFSNGDLYADQAWILCSRHGCDNLYVLNGGLNKWFTQIMKPQFPPATAPSEVFDLYTFRKAASMYFGGGTPEQINTDISKKNIPIIMREKKTATAGGC